MLFFYFLLSVAFAGDLLPGRFICASYFSRPVYRTYFLRDDPLDYIEVCDRVELAGGVILYANPQKGTIYFQAPRRLEILGSAVVAADDLRD